MVLYLAPGEGSSRAAFVASRKVGGAVRRNRARRLLREAWRGIRPRVAGGALLILVARNAIVGSKSQDVSLEVEKLLSRAGLLAR